MKNFVLLSLCFGLFCSFAKADEASDLKLQLMKSTKINAVTGSNSDKFVEDADPDTLEIVFLPASDKSPSRVSADGEAIFIRPDITDREQSDLIGKAFDIRVQRRIQKKDPN